MAWLSASVAAACCPVHSYHRAAVVDPAPTLDELVAACQTGGLRVPMRTDYKPQDGEPASGSLYVTLPDGRLAWLELQGAALWVMATWGHHPTDAERRDADDLFAAVVERLAAGGLAPEFAQAELAAGVRCEGCEREQR